MNEPVLLQRLAATAGREPGRAAFVFIEDDGSERVLTFGQLHEDSLRLAGCLRAAAPHAARALLMHRPGPEFLVALCACLMSGITAVPTFPPSARLGARTADRFERLVADADPQLVLLERAGVARAWQAVGAGRAGQLQWLATDDTGDLAGGPAVPDAQAPAIIQYTSGSTAAPRGVMLSHDNLVANLESTATRFCVGAGSRIVSWLPPYHDMGLIGGLLPVLAYGCQVVAMAPSTFIRSPERWLEAIDRHRGTHSGGPGFAYGLCRERIAPDVLARLDLSSWQVAFCGAEAIRAGVLRAFADFAAPAGFRAASLMPCYGLAEATLMVTARAAGAGLATHARDENGQSIERTLCGAPAQDVALAIVDRHGARLADGMVGEIWVAGAQVSAGYWRHDALNAQVFGQHLDGRGGWMRTGDLGYLAAGELVVTGRVKDLIIRRGHNYYPADLEEAVALAHPAIDPGAVAAFSADGPDGEQVVVACEIRRERRRGADGDQVARAAQGALADALGIRADALVLLRPGGLPRTTSGKVSRSAARAAWAEGSLPVLEERAPQPDQRPPAAAAPLYACVARIAGRPAEQLGPGWTLGELGIDSLRTVELTLALEHELGLVAPPDSLRPGLALGELQALLAPPAPAAQGAPLPSEWPASAFQQAFLSGAGDAANGFMVTVILRVPAALDVGALEGALDWLGQRHPALGLRFVAGQAGWTAQRRAGAAIGLSRLTVAGVRDSGRRWRELLDQQVRAAIDVRAGALAHAVWFDRGVLENGVLALALHHLVVDAVSVSVIVAGLQQAYERLAQGQPLPQPQPDGYPAWVLAMHARAADPAWRAAELPRWADAVPARPAADDERFERSAVFTLDAAASGRFLTRFADSAARHDALLAAWTHAWAALSGERQVTVMLEHHGRGRCGGAPLDAVGWMVNFYPITLAPDADIAAHAEHTARSHAALAAHAAGYGLLRFGPAAAGAAQAGAAPRLGFAYRAEVDQGFRAGSRFAVLSVDHQGPGWLRARAAHGLLPDVELLASLVAGKLVWFLGYRPGAIAAQQVRALGDGVGDALARLLDAVYPNP